MKHSTISDPIFVKRIRSFESRVRKQKRRTKLKISCKKFRQSEKSVDVFHRRFIKWAPAFYCRGLTIYTGFSNSDY